MDSRQWLEQTQLCTTNESNTMNLVFDEEYGHDTKSLLTEPFRFFFLEIMELSTFPFLFFYFFIYNFFPVFSFW